MIVAISQPLFLGGLTFWDKMNKSDTMILLDDVQFARRDFQHRNKIRTRHDFQWMNVPLEKKGNFTEKIKDMKIDNDEAWELKILEQVIHSYKKAPHFDEFYPSLKFLMDSDWNTLGELTCGLTTWVADSLGFETKVKIASELDCHSTNASEHLAELCEAVEGNDYLSGKLGRNYLDKSPFEMRGYSIEYQEFTHPVYKQMFEPFVENMSILDLMMNHGVNSRGIIDGSIDGLKEQDDSKV